MGLLDEIKQNYMDADGLVAPFPINTAERNVCGNGTMFLGELAVLLALRGEASSQTRIHFGQRCGTCVCLVPGHTGMPCRSPLNTTEQDSPDNMLGIAAGCIATGQSWIAQDILKYGYKHWGSFNNENPGKWTTVSFLWRQPQLLCALKIAVGNKPNLFLRIVAAGSLLVSCRKVPAGETDPYRLAWLLWYCTKDDALCRWASKFWWKRLYKAYPDGMMGVRAIYYHGLNGEPHPFTKYSVDGN